MTPTQIPRCPAISDRQQRCLWVGEHPGVDHRWDRDKSAVAHPALDLRRADSDDRHRVWAWRNAPDVRAVSFDEKPIAWPNHVKWYDRTLGDRSRAIFIVTFGGEGYEPVGVLRLDVQGPLGYVSIILDEKVRGRGLATPVLLLLDDEITRRSVPVPHALVALIKAPNPRSHGAFVRAEYQLAYHDERLTMLVKPCQG